MTAPRTTLLAAVAARAGGRCQCPSAGAAGCGGEHRSGLEHCGARDTRRSPLVAAPLDPATPDHLAASLPAEQLLALCPPCFTRRRKASAAARAERGAAALAASQTDLFDLFTTDERTAP